MIPVEGIINTDFDGKPVLESHLTYIKEIEPVLKFLISIKMSNSF